MVSAFREHSRRRAGLQERTAHGQSEQNQQSDSQRHEQELFEAGSADGLSIGSKQKAHRRPGNGAVAPAIKDINDDGNERQAHAGPQKGRIDKRDGGRWHYRIPAFRVAR